jgi:hypothetical protein
MRSTGLSGYNKLHMRFILLLFCCGLQFLAQSQPTRREIIDHKIFAVESTSYNKVGTKMNVTKNYYSVRGCDSVELNNDKPSFTFKEELDAKGRVKQLTRYVVGGNEDELHLYEYNNKGYTIEVIAHGAGTIFFKTYTAKHDQIEEVQSSTDTFYFSYNAVGKIAKVAQGESGETFDIAVTEFNEKGFPVVQRTVGDDFPRLIRFVYNEQGLPVEARRLKMNNSQEQLILRTVYTYEFR